MCFSETASFVTGAALCATGSVALSKVTRRNQIPFASIPFLFGIQQLSEGVLWLSINETIPEKWLWPSAFTFLLFAQVIWPAWVSFSVLTVERDSKRRRIIFGLLLLGSALALYHVYCLMKYPIAVSAGAHHIDYLRDFPQRPAKLISAVYLLVTILPLFISSMRGTKLLGAAIAVSCLLAYFFYHEFFISTWCFFAAIVSVIVVLILFQWSKEPRK